MMSIGSASQIKHGDQNSVSENIRMGFFNTTSKYDLGNLCLCVYIVNN